MSDKFQVFTSAVALGLYPLHIVLFNFPEKMRRNHISRQIRMRVFTSSFASNYDISNNFDNAQSYGIEKLFRRLANKRLMPFMRASNSV